MKVNQMYALLNDISAEMMGTEAIQANDLTGFVSMGRSVIGTSGMKDKWLNTLVDKFMGIIVRTLDLEIEYPQIMRHNFEYGAILSKLSLEPMQGSVAHAWEIGGYSADDVKDAMFTIAKPTARQTFFDGINSWEVDLSVPDNILKSAFESPEQMGAFMSAMMSAMVDSVTNQINVTNKYCVNNFIGEKLYSDQNVIHLITESGFSGTAEAAIMDKDFLAYMGKRIYDTIGYMNVPSALYNEEGAIRRSTRDDLHVFLLNEVESAYSTYLMSNTWWREYIELPLHQRVTAWQQTGYVGDSTATPPVPFEAPNLQKASTINIKTSAGNTINVDYVVAAVIDREALGTTVFDRKVMTDRLNRLELTQYTNKVDVGYFNDLSENAAIFVLD